MSSAHMMMDGDSSSDSLSVSRSGDGKCTCLSLGSGSTSKTSSGCSRLISTGSCRKSTSSVSYLGLLGLDLMVILGLLRLAGAKSLGCFTGGVLGRGLTGVGRRGVLFKRSSHWFGICFSLYSLSIRAASSPWVPVCRSIGIRSLGFTFGHSRWDCRLTRVLSQVGHMKQNPECCSSKCFFPSSTYRTLSYLGTTDTRTGSPVIQISKTGVTHDISQMDIGRQTDKLYPCI